jgi:hypothetical protein
VACQRGQHGGGLEGALEDHRGAGVEHAVRRHEQPVGVEDGQRMKRTSPSVNRQSPTSASAFEARLSRVSITPFDRPVVPDV